MEVEVGTGLYSHLVDPVSLNCLRCPLLLVVLSLDPSKLGMFVILDGSFRILSAVSVVYSSDLLPAPLIFPRSVFLVIVENVL